MDLNETKKRIVILYDYFTPAFKAGGPVQSITNMVRLLGDRYEFYVVTTNRDLDGTILTVAADRWVDFEGKASVFYASPKYQSFGKVTRLIREVKPQVVYINGLFSLFATVYPLAGNVLHGMRQTRYIVAPRGMFQQGALALKATKKRVFLSLMKPFLRRPNVTWHATDLQEQQDIRRHVGSRVQVTIAGNVPAVLNNNPASLFRKDELRVVTVALVVRMKNHITFLNVLKDYKGEKRVIYDIYGPLRDHEYWQECLRLIERMPPNVTVNYKGAVEPSMVAGILSQYHCFVLPTFGENFGHSIFEALAAGLPVLISDKTPWNHVQDLQAGWVVPDNNRMDWHKTFKEAITLTPQQWQKMSKNARLVARNYLKEAGLEGKYQRLLGR